MLLEWFQFWVQWLTWPVFIGFNMYWTYHTFYLETLTSTGSVQDTYNRSDWYAEQSSWRR